MDNKGQYRKRAGNVIRICIAVIIILCVGIRVQRKVALEANEKLPFKGKGTYEIPYQIRNVEELALLADKVNHGTTFTGIYFAQMADLDMKNYGNWTPIGTYDSGFAFAGIYDGMGHTISNITIDGNLLSHPNVGLFGILDGIVCNLGIESGVISGSFVGSIASHAGGAVSALIVNCYNKAELSGTARCGGIADNFGGGRIICCANQGYLMGPVIGGIVSYTAGKIYGCQSEDALVNEYFMGSMEECTQGQVDFSLINAKLEKAADAFDLHKLSLKKWRIGT